MRKMFSQNQIKNLVQEAITEGQIEIPQELPSQEGAEIGDVLKIGADGLEWGAGGGGSPVAYEGVSQLPSGVTFESWSLHRAIKEGNILWFCATGAITNSTASSVSLGTIATVTLPSEISSKIYRVDGSACNVAGDPSYAGVTIGVGVFSGYEAGNLWLNSELANQIDMIFAAKTLGANESIRIDFRIPIFLEIGEVE